jgi:hypothetical protein
LCLHGEQRLGPLIIAVKTSTCFLTIITVPPSGACAQAGGISRKAVPKLVGLREEVCAGMYTLVMEFDKNCPYEEFATRQVRTQPPSAVRRVLLPVVRDRPR